MEAMVGMPSYFKEKFLIKEKRKLIEGDKNFGKNYSRFTNKAKPNTVCVKATHEQHNIKVASMERMAAANKR